MVAIYDQIQKETGNDYSYQLPSIKRLAVALDAFIGGLDASDTGTGKTPVAIAVAKVLGRSVFVICPKNVIPPGSEARRFGVRIVAINYEMLRDGNTERLGGSSGRTQGQASPSSSSPTAMPSKLTSGFRIR